MWEKTIDKVDCCVLICSSGMLGSHSQVHLAIYEAVWKLVTKRLRYPHVSPIVSPVSSGVSSVYPGASPCFLFYVWRDFWGGVRIWNFQGWSRKNHVVFPGVFVLGLKISDGCNTILWIFQGWSLILSGISRDKLKNLKIPEGFKKLGPQSHSVCFYFWNSPFGLENYSLSLLFIFIKSFLSKMFDRGLNIYASFLYITILKIKGKTFFLLYTHASHMPLLTYHICRLYIYDKIHLWLASQSNLILSKKCLFFLQNY